MATESPIRISEGTQNWPALNQSTQYGPSSSKITFEDLDLFMKGQKFQSLEKDVTPSRSESAPPSMEGSLKAFENLFPKQKSTNPRVVDPTVSAFNRENEVQFYDDSSPSSHHTSAAVSDQKFRNLQFQTSIKTLSDSKMNPHAKSAEGSVGLSWNRLPVHKEESEDDGSSEHNASLGFEKDDTISDDSRQTMRETRNSFDVTAAHNSDTEKSRKKEQPIPPNSMLQNQAAPKESNHSRVHGSYSQIIYPGISNSYGGLNHFYYGSSSVPVSEDQPILQSPGFTPPFYAPAAAFMTSTSQFYPNLQPSGIFTPQYSNGGYAFNAALLPTYLPGFPHQGAVPMAFGRAPFPISGASDGGNIHTYNMQNLKFYNQIGAPIQQFLQVPVPDLYGTYGHFGHQPPGDSAVANQVGSHDLKRSGDLGLLNDQTSQPSDGAGYNSSNVRGGNISSGHYSLERPTNVGSLVRFPTPSAVSPAVPAKPLGGTYSHGGRNNVSHVHSGGNSRKAWGPLNQSWGDTNSYSFLEELRSGNGQKFDLSDVLGHIGDFSADQHGSRFIQQKLESCSVEEKALVFKEILPNAPKLTTDVFGNYVIQKLFEYGSPEQRRDLASQLEGHILTFSLQMYGCRVIQKAIEVVDLEQKTRLVKELDGHVMRCVRDQNGNHVIQKCIERIPIDNIHFIIASFRGQVATLSTHPYGCRVVQRILEHDEDESRTQFIVDEILDSVCSLAQDQYGNYVTQHVLERGKPCERSEIIKRLSGSIVQLSQHKFASNVIEKCLEYTDSTSRGIIIKEIVGDGNTNDNLLVMMKDQYANYVIQRILQKCTSDQREMLLGQIRTHLPVLKKYTYGKHIVARFEKLYGEEIQASES